MKFSWNMIASAILLVLQGLIQYEGLFVGKSRIIPIIAHAIIELGILKPIAAYNNPDGTPAVTAWIPDTLKAKIRGSLRKL